MHSELDRLLDSTTYEDTDEALLFAKLMAKQEALDNKKRKIKSTFWVSIVSILSQQLNRVQVK